MVTPVHLRHSYIMLRILTHLSYLQGKLLFCHGISFFSIFFLFLVIHSLFFSLIRWIVTRKPLGPPPKTMVSGLLPSLYKKGGTGTVSLMCWWRVLHVKIWPYNRLEADLAYLKTFSDKLKLVRRYKNFFLDFKNFLCLFVLSSSIMFYLYLVIMSSTYLRSH